MGIGSLSFLTPMALAALAALPVLWWLLRLTPPTPRTVHFPPMVILMRLGRGREMSTQSPPWLLALRLALLLAVIFAAAHPVMNPTGKLAGTGPLTLIIDDDWAAAKNWNQRRQTMARLIGQAEREGRPVMLAQTAAASAKPQARMMAASAAAGLAAAMLPKPWSTDRGPLLQELTARLANQPPGQIVWLSDGLGGPDTEAQIRSVAAVGEMHIYTEQVKDLPLVLLPPVATGETIDLTASRLQGRGQVAYRMLARDRGGVVLDGVDVSFADGARRAQASLRLPTELRNRLARIEIDGENTVGSVLLVDESWARRPIGLVLPSGETTTDTGNIAQPLLSPLYYLERALRPVGDVRVGGLDDLLKRPLAVLILADQGRLPDGDRDRLNKWMNKGGLLLRFAGPTLAQAVDRGTPADNGRGALLPSPVRGNTRTLGGVLSWNKPVALAAFPEDSPFYGIAIPKDVTVERQLLFEPQANSEQKIWARLADGTPLISATRKGRGWLVLTHTTADPRWSNLALSGLFVSILDRIVGLSQGVDDGVADQNQRPLSPLLTLDGAARLGTPPPQARPIAAGKFMRTVPGPDHPPGFYGRNNTTGKNAGADRRALNLSSGLARLTAFPNTEFITEHYGESRQIDFRPWLLLAAFVLAVADLAALIYLKGLYRRSGATVAVALFAVLLSMPAAAAETGSVVPAAALKTSLAYYITGDARQDAKSRAGLLGLGHVVNIRTAAKLGAPTGIDPETDELAFYPLIYWPLGSPAKTLSDDAVERINGYLSRGGTILFDTTQGNGGGANLDFVARRLGLPILVPVGPDHVLGRAFYLLKSFPGRWADGRLWVEGTTERVNDGVSPVIAGANDWAAAWATDDAGRPLYAMGSGGRRQRELSFRFGVNLVMYVLTGNYKSDQIHLPAIIERLRR